LLKLDSKDILKQKLEELEKVKELKNILPEIFENGKINLEKFQNILFDLPSDKTHSTRLTQNLERSQIIRC
jgi:hypothetical protein